MNTTSIDIVNLIESNPIARFNQTYQSKLIEKLQTKFSDYQQQLFLSSFYCYLKYDKLNDFVIDLDDVWEWLGFIKKSNAKRLIKSLFIADKDIKILLLRTEQQDLEYEFMNGDNWEKGEIHIDDLITETSGGDACENWIEEIYTGLRTVRVKYLDKEDIESLNELENILNLDIWKQTLQNQISN